jgi:hypothetical protein
VFTGGTDWGFKCLIRVNFLFNGQEPNVEKAPKLFANQQVKKYHVIILVPLVTNRQAGVTAALVFLWHYGGSWY